MIIPFSEYDAEDFLEKTLKYSGVFLPIRYQTRNAELDPFPYFMATDEYVLLTDLNLKKRSPCQKSPCSRHLYRKIS